MRILVTGGAGYIGAVLIPLLVEAGHEVGCVDANYYTNKPLVPYEEACLPFHTDIRDLPPEIFKGMDCVIHLAALSNDPMGAIDPFLTMHVNYLASVRTAVVAKHAGVKKFIFSSSCSVYGVNDAQVTEMHPTNPLTAYADSKLRAEEEIGYLADANFCPVFMRNATVYGMSPNFRVDLAVNNLTAHAYTTNKILLQSQGTAIRPFIHVEDLAKAFLVMAEAPDRLVWNQIFNIGSNDQNHKIIEIAEVIHKLYPKAQVEIAEGATVDKRNYYVDFTKFDKYFPDFRFRWNLHMAINDMWEVFRLNQFSENDIIRYTRLNELQDLINTGMLDNKLYWRD